MKDDTDKLKAKKSINNTKYNSSYENVEAKKIKSKKIPQISGETDNTETANSKLKTNSYNEGIKLAKANTSNSVTNRANTPILRNNENGLENPSGGDGSNDSNTSGEEGNDGDEFINDSIYAVVNGSEVDTTKPTITIKTDAQNNWVKIGEELNVTIISSEELQNAPKVFFNDIEATVTGKNRVFNASLEVTNNLNEGYVEVKVNNYKDLVGNEGDEVIAKEKNIDEPIVVDNTPPSIENVFAVIEEGKEYKAGDTFEIVVEFEDKNRGSIEYIKTDEIPKLDLKFGENDATGELKCTYTPGEYVQEIIYTYTISENDNGMLKVAGVSGKITDAAGNVAEINDKLNITIEEIDVEKAPVPETETKTDDNKVQDDRSKNNSSKDSTVTENKGESSNSSNESNITQKNTKKEAENNKDNSSKTSNDSAENKKESKVENSNIQRILTPGTGDMIVTTICVLLIVSAATILIEYCYRKKKQ